MATKKKGNTWEREKRDQMRRQRAGGKKRERERAWQKRRRERGAAVFSGDRGPALGSRHRLCATRCILLTLSPSGRARARAPGMCMCASYPCEHDSERIPRRIYIWPEGGAGSALAFARASARACTRVCVCVCTCADAFVYVCRGGQWFRRFYYSALRVELTQVSVVKKPYVRRARHTSFVRATKREGTREREGGRRTKRTSGWRREGGRRCNVHGVSHTLARVYACTHSRIYGGNAFAMRTTVERRARCQTRLRLLDAARSNACGFTRDVKFRDSSRSRRGHVGRRGASLRTDGTRSRRDLC